jgi:pyrimidine-nucleoside phosphorylase
MLYAANAADYEECVKAATKTLYDGSAKKKLANLVAALGGNSEYIYNPSLFKESKVSAIIAADKSGYIHKMDTELIGVAAVVLGAGRVTRNPDRPQSRNHLPHTVGDFETRATRLRPFTQATSAKRRTAWSWSSTL